MEKEEKAAPAKNILYYSSSQKYTLDFPIISKIKTQNMAEDFEELSMELHSRMEVFQKSQQRVQKAEELTRQMETILDRNHARIHKLSESLKQIGALDLEKKQQRMALKKSLGEDADCLPFKTKREVLQANLAVFRKFYKKKAEEFDR